MHHTDLPDALADRPHGHWRVNFHVPLHYSAPGINVNSAAALLDADFFRQALLSTTHLETETYTYAILTQKYQDTGTSVSNELCVVSQAAQTAAKAIRHGDDHLPPTP